ncbi:MAG: glycosyltransferase, partial [Nitrospira sp.]
EGAQLRAEGAQLRAERAQLIAETSTLGYRATKRVRNFLRARAPWAHHFVGFLMSTSYHLWRKADIYRRLLQIRARLSACVVTNTSWPNGKPLVSVIIPCFNYGNYLREAIDSVLAQTFKDVEIIIVDDGSTDPYTQHVLDTLEKPNARIIRQNNQGVSAARNNGIREAQGKYICCLDADDVLTPTYLEKAVYILETKALDICYSWVQLFGDEDMLWKTAPFNIEELTKWNIVSTSAVFAKSNWKRAGGYKKNFHGIEDWEFWITLAEGGARGHRIPEPLFLYRKHGRSLTTETDLEKLSNDIKALHSTLYSGRTDLAKLRRQQFKRFVVKKPLCNMLRAGNNAANNVSQISILLVVPWFDRGGSSVLLQEVFSRLRKKDAAVTAIATNPSEHPINDSGLLLYESYTKDCFNLPTFLEDRNDTVQFIDYLITSRKVEILFLAGSRFVYESLPRLKRKFPKLIVIDQLYNKIGHTASNREFRNYIDLNIVSSEEVRDHLMETGESGDRISLIPHGVDIDKYDPASLEYTEAARYRSYKGFTFGFLGRLTSEKRPQDIVQLATMLPECQFMICGDGPMMKSLQQEIDSRNLAQRVHIKNRFDNVMEFYSGIDALVVPSDIEGLPLVLLEAMALGLPVIATKVGRIPLAISHGQNGFLYEPGDVAQLHELACKLLQLSTEHKKRIGEIARQTVVKEYDIGRCAESYHGVFMSSLGRARYLELSE